MKATYRWIKDYVPAYRGTVEEMCRAFTMSGTEVEYFVPTGGDDWMIEFAVTSNRVDCLGVIGLARELAAVSGCPLVLPSVELNESAESVASATSVEVADEAPCSRFTARVIEGVRVGPSPDWLRARLESIGLRPVNNVVDATNFAMFETNQPFHAFDIDRLHERRLIVRPARSGESITAINGKVYELNPADLLICDPRRPVGIAGVMGGSETEVGDQTCNVLLEAAAFDRLSVRATAHRLALHSDASHRFERGIDREMTEWASRRCARLLVEVAGGKLRSGVIDVDRGETRPAAIGFRSRQVKRITGIDVPWDRCRQIFHALELDVDDGAEDSARITPPSWRRDLEREIDLVEEVIRVHGLEQIPVETEMRVMAVRERRSSLVRERVKATLIASGFLETLTTSFIAEPDARLSLFSNTQPVTIRNAMRKEENALRQSLVPSLLAVRKTNQDRFNDDVRVAECTVVYLARQPGEIPEHLPIVSGLLDGDYREARGVVESIARALGLAALGFEPLDRAGGDVFDVDHSATVRLADGELIGFVGRPTRELAERFDLKSTPQLFELRLDLMTAAADLDPVHRPLSKFPPVKRDLAMVVDEEVTWGQIEAALLGLELPNLARLSFFDEYRGKQVGAGKKSLAFSLDYRSFDRTLTGEEVEAAQLHAITQLRRQFGAEIR